MLNAMWASRSVPMPRVSRSGSSNRLWTPLTQWAKRPQNWKNATKNRHRLTPVTMSAFIMGMLLTVIRASRLRRPRLYRPMAAKVPATVAMRVASRETSRVIYTLSIISRF